MAQDQEAVDLPSSPQSSGSKEHSSVKEEDHPDGREDLASNNSADDQMANSKPRDPDRPKRKKARRACSACQRAHLTCSDNRPCERCMKRNLADQCHDGTRKRAKYMHDVPAEVLVPSHGVAAAYANMTGFGHPHNVQHRPSMDMGQPHTFHAAAPGSSPSSYQSFQQNGNHSSMPPPTVDTQALPLIQSHQSPASSTFNSAQPSPMQHYGSVSNQVSSQSAMNAQYPDQSDSSLYTFSPSNMNFGNHYGALEMGMLEQMTSNAQQQQQNGTDMYSQPTYVSTQYPGQAYALNPNNAWATSQGPQMQQVSNNFDPSFDDQQLRRTSQTLPHAFTIGAGGSSLSSSSPASSIDFLSGGGNHSPLKAQTSSQYPTTGHQPQKSQSLDEPCRKSTKKQSQKTAHNKPQSPSKSDPASIYHSVKDPYPYTEAFHRLFRELRRRFPSKKIARIASTFANIRPSFIISTSSLVREDLIFMEQIFQRSLLEYYGFLDKLGTPTIVCRRTGEVAQTTQAFQMLAGWTSDVLLGREPNLNINTNSARSHDTSANGSNVPTATGKSGFNTPAQPRTPAEPGDGIKLVEEHHKRSGKKHQPVFLAELLDEDSVVKFYEDFAQLAFADSKGSVSGPCKLLRYRTAESEKNGKQSQRALQKRKKSAVKHEEGTLKVENQDGMKKLGAEDGKVSCMYCWMVKRDVFNMPSIIVINFLPILF